MKAKDFCLPAIDENGKEFTFCLRDYLNKGKKIIIYFYPKDNTPGCTTQACDFRDNLNILKDYAFVVGISPDSIESHKKFKDKYDLNYILASDNELNVLKEYQAYGEKNLYGKKTLGVIRSTYILDEDGTVLKHWKNVKAKGHIDQILTFFGVKK